MPSDNNVHLISRLQSASSAFPPSPSSLLVSASANKISSSARTMQSSFQNNRSALNSNNKLQPTNKLNMNDNFCPVIKTSKTWVLPPRPKPGRKPSPNSAHNNDSRRRKNKNTSASSNKLSCSQNTHRTSNNQVKQTKPQSKAPLPLSTPPSATPTATATPTAIVPTTDAEVLLENELRKATQENSILKIELSKLVSDLKSLRQQVTTKIDNESASASSSVPSTAFNSVINSGTTTNATTPSSTPVVSATSTLDSPLPNASSSSAGNSTKITSETVDDGMRSRSQSPHAHFVNFQLLTSEDSSMSSNCVDSDHEFESISRKRTHEILEFDSNDDEYDDDFGNYGFASYHDHADPFSKHMKLSKSSINDHLKTLDLVEDDDSQRALSIANPPTSVVPTSTASNFFDDFIIENDDDDEEEEEEGNSKETKAKMSLSESYDSKTPGSNNDDTATIMSSSTSTVPSLISSNSSLVSLTNDLNNLFLFNPAKSRDHHTQSLFFDSALSKTGAGTGIGAMSFGGSMLSKHSTLNSELEDDIVIVNSENITNGTDITKPARSTRKCDVDYETYFNKVIDLPNGGDGALSLDFVDGASLDDAIDFTFFNISNE